MLLYTFAWALLKPIFLAPILVAGHQNTKSNPCDWKRTMRTYFWNSLRPQILSLPFVFPAVPYQNIPKESGRSFNYLPLYNLWNWHHGCSFVWERDKWKRLPKEKNHWWPLSSMAIPGVKPLKHHSHWQKEKLIWGFGVSVSRAKDELQVHCKRKFKPRSAKKIVPWLLWAPSPEWKELCNSPRPQNRAELWLVIQSVREGLNIIKEFGGNLFGWEYGPCPINDHQQHDIGSSRGESRLPKHGEMRSRT